MEFERQTSFETSEALPGAGAGAGAGLEAAPPPCLDCYWAPRRRAAAPAEGGTKEKVN